MNVIFITLIATLFIQMGYFFWKLSAANQPKIGNAPAKKVLLALLKDWRWLLGFACTSLGWVFFVQATALGDISLVQPLMSAGDILLVIMAVVFLKERLGFKEWFGVLLTIMGATALGWNIHDVIKNDFQGITLALLIFAAFLLGGFFFLLAKIKPQLFRLEIILALIVGLCFGCGAILTKALTTTSSSWRILINPLLLAVVLANVAGLILLQAAFQRGRASVIVPLQLAMANFLTVLAGVFIFAEPITSLRAFGIFLIIGGIALLQTKHT
jgi:uncharacterized membrane protein